jgi:LPS export ABC transporter protein LptC
MRAVALIARRWQTWVWIAVLALGGYIVYLLVTGLLTPQEPVQPSDNQMEMHGVVGQGSHGPSHWQFTADSSEISADGYTTTYHGVHQATYYRAGKPAYHLTATTITVDARNQNYTASEGVHMWSVAPHDAEDIRTTDAYWNNSAQLLTCTTPATLIYKGSELRTTGLTVNLRTGLAEFGDTSVDFIRPSPTPTSANR